MKRTLLLLVMILGIPIIGFSVTQGIKAHFNSEFQSALRKYYPDADPIKIESLTIDILCQSPDPSFRGICSTNANINLMSSVALFSGALGVFLLLVIFISGLIARNSRTLLLVLFKPGLYITGIVLVVLILLNRRLNIFTMPHRQSWDV